MTEWHPLWPTPAEMLRILHDRSVYYKAPFVAPWAVKPHHVQALLLDNAWAFWIMNPRLDTLVPSPKVKLEHWVNMVLTPLHAPCKAAISSLGHPLIQRVRCGEVVQSHRPRYISDNVVDESDEAY